MSATQFKRILLKLSGEALKGDRGYGISPDVIDYVTDEIRSVAELGVEMGIVIGGGNIFRGIAASAYNMERVPADHIGMLATVINSLALQDALEKKGMPTRVQSAISMPQVAEPMILRRALSHLNKGRNVIFAGGTGNPYFSTDTAAVLRAQEIQADILIKATKVDGLYDTDPVKDKNAKFIKQITYKEVLSRQLAVMDTTAVCLAMDNDLPLAVFNMNQKGNIKNFVYGERVGSLISNNPI